MSTESLSDSTVMLRQGLAITEYNSAINAVNAAIDNKITVLARLTTLLDVMEDGVSTVVVTPALAGIEEVDMSLEDMRRLPVSSTKHVGVCEGVRDTVRKGIKKVLDTIVDFFKKAGKILKALFKRLFGFNKVTKEKLGKSVKELKNTDIDNTKLRELEYTGLDFLKYDAFIHNTDYRLILTAGVDALNRALEVIRGETSNTDAHSYNEAMSAIFEGYSTVAKGKAGAQKAADREDMFKFFGIKIHKNSSTGEYSVESKKQAPEVKDFVLGKIGILDKQKLELVGTRLKDISKDFEDRADEISSILDKYGESEQAIRNAMKQHDGLTEKELRNRASAIKSYQTLIKLVTGVNKTFLSTHLKYQLSCQTVIKLVVKKCK